MNMVENVSIVEMRSRVSLTSCEICGQVVRSVHCKLRCVNCGYTRDCSDP